MSDDEAQAHQRDAMRVEWSEMIEEVGLVTIPTAVLVRLLVDRGVLSPADRQVFLDRLDEAMKKAREGLRTAPVKTSDHA
jgi:hypothetical protein